MTKHARLSPSKAHRWLVCPGSLYFEQPPDSDKPESIWAEEGQHAHAILEEILQNKPVLVGDRVDGVPATPLRIQQAIEVRDFLRQWHKVHPNFVLETERPVNITTPMGHPESHDMDGTLDATMWNHKELVVLDAKFGFVRVEPKENPQLYLYAIGMLYEIERLLGQHPSAITVVIAQPDYEGVMQFREHRMPFFELVQWVNLHGAALKAAWTGDAHRNASSEYACRYCPGRLVCPERMAMAYDIASEEWREHKYMTDLLPLVPHIRKICDDLESRAVTLLSDGSPIPGFKLVESRSIRRWSPNHNITGTAKEQNLEIVVPKIMTPAQFERAHGQTGKAFTKLYAVTPRGGPKLVPDSDPRPEFKPEKPDFTQEDVDALEKEE